MLIYNATFDKNTRKLSFEDKAGREIYSFTVPERAPAPVDDITKHLTFRATQDGSTVMLKNTGSIYRTYETSRDGGSTWKTYTLDDAITLNTGDEVSFRVRAYQKPSPGKYYYFKMTGKIEAWHNVMSMKSHSLGNYNPMEEYEFYFMFAGCKSLTKAPVLPSTRLAENCYHGMFSGCQSLTKAPALPATVLYRWCYTRMFEDCQSLTKAPELPATSLPQSCYYRMFSGCQSLNEVRISATKTATGALDHWLEGVAATGDFYCDPNATIFPSDSGSGCPSGWTRHALADYPVTP